MIENRIKEVREEIGMSQDELSKRAGVSRSMISALEMNKKEDCKLSTMLSISEALGKPFTDIFLSQ